MGADVNTKYEILKGLKGRECAKKYVKWFVSMKVCRKGCEDWRLVRLHSLLYERLIVLIRKNKLSSDVNTKYQILKGSEVVKCAKKCVKGCVCVCVVKSVWKGCEGLAIGQAT